MPIDILKCNTDRDPMDFKRLHQVSLEALLTWGLGLLIASCILTAALAFAVWRFTNGAFNEYEKQDIPMALLASSSQDNWLRARGYEDNFLLSPGGAVDIGEMKARYVTLWKTNLDDIHVNLKKIRETAGANDYAVVSLLPSIETALANYEAGFNSVVDLVMRLGDADSGLEGEMTTKVRAAEEVLAQARLPLFVESLIALRRMQTDFVLAGKDQYVGKFLEEMAKFDRLGTNDGLTSSHRQSLLAAVKEYSSLFKEYVAIVRNLELKKRSYVQAAQSLDSSIDQLQYAALQNADAGLKRVKQRIGRTTYWAAIVALAVVLFGIVTAAFVSRRIRAATQRIIGFAARLAAGKLDARLGQMETGKFGALESALNTMADNLQETDDSMIHQAEVLIKRNRRMALLSEMTGLLQTVASVDEAREVVGRHMASIAVGATGAVYLYEESGNYLDTLTHWGPGKPPASFAPDDCWALRRGQPYGTAPGEVTAILVCPHVKRGDTTHQYLCLPMIAQGGTFGLVHILFGNDESTILSDEEAQFAARLTDQLSLALANIKLRETLREQSLRDPLTDLFNRRYLQASLDREFARAAREKGKVAVLMLDVDHFKRFNDTHGHEAGDAALILLGRALKGSCRGGDLACRFGGEEFTVVLPATNCDNARQWATRLLDMVRKMEISVRGTTLPHLTVSIGIALYPADGEDPDSVLRAADLALYTAKHSGRDRCVAKDAAVEQESRDI